MRYFPTGKVSRVIVASLTPGDLFLEGIEEIIKKENIESGVVVSCIGSFRKFKGHTITWAGMPPKDEYVSVDGPVEIGCIQGLIVQGEPHLHCSYTDIDKKHTDVAHVEHGCEVAYLIELCIMVIDDMPIKKAKDPDNPGVVAFVPK